MEGGVGLFTIGNRVTVNGRGEGRLLLLGQEVVWLWFYTLPFLRGVFRQQGP